MIADRPDEATVSVALDTWPEAVRQARADGFEYFDWLSALDDGDGRIVVILHLWSRRDRRHRFLRTVAADGRAPSIAAVFGGAGWHEREAAEMFGLEFVGAPDSRPLLLPDGFDGHPLRKDFPLSARAVEEWPGTHEPTEHGPAARPPGRRRPTAPGVPEWVGRGATASGVGEAADV